MFNQKNKRNPKHQQKNVDQQRRNLKLQPRQRREKQHQRLKQPLVQPQHLKKQQLEQYVQKYKILIFHRVKQLDVHLPKSKEKVKRKK